MRALALLFGIVASVVGLSGELSTRDNIFVDHLEQPTKILAPGDPFFIRCVTPWQDMVNAWKKDDVVLPSGSRFTMTSVRLKKQETKNLFDAFKSSLLARPTLAQQANAQSGTYEEEQFGAQQRAYDSRDTVTRRNGGAATLRRLQDKLEALAEQKLELWTLKVDQVEISDSGNYSCGGEADTYFSLRVEKRKAERSEESSEGKNCPLHPQASSLS